MCDRLDRGNLRTCAQKQNRRLVIQPPAFALG
jgi:hypothetical protein